MVVLAVVVFAALQYFKAGYGYLRSKGWGPMIDNKLGWVLMEIPVLIVTALIYIYAQGWQRPTATVLVSFLVVHYIQRSLVYPFLMRGKSKIPITVVLMGAVFNVINAYLISGWLFILAPEERYTLSWLYSPQFIIGALIFIFGMIVNLHSDYIIRHLRKPGDTRHYIPRGGMFRYVSSANYYGEITEWFGFAILTWSLPGIIFCMWTFANLAPRANSLYDPCMRSTPRNSVRSSPVSNANDSYLLYINHGITALHSGQDRPVRTQEPRHTRFCLRGHVRWTCPYAAAEGLPYSSGPRRRRHDRRGIRLD